MNLSLPLHFGQRKCDRVFIMEALKHHSISETTAYGIMFRIWQNFAADREEEWLIPKNTEEQLHCPTLSILANYACPGGEFPQAAELLTLGLRSGFLTTSDAGENQLRLAAKDFSETNRRSADSKTLAQMGGIARSRKTSEKFAIHSTNEQIELFRQQNNHILTELDPERIRQGLIFIKQAERLMQWPVKTDSQFLSALLPRALTGLDLLGEHKNDFLGWLIPHRDSGTLPERIDLLIDKIPELLPQVKRWKESVEG